jgi:hypothetical protein
MQVSPKQHPNYNLFMTVDHPEWVLKYVKYVLPSLPEGHWPKVRPYIQKHHGLLKELDWYTTSVPVFKTNNYPIVSHQKCAKYWHNQYLNFMT